MVKKYLPLLLILFVTSLGAQNIRVMSSVNKTRLTQSEQVQLTLKITGNVGLKLSEPAPPQVSGLSFRNVVSSSSSSTSIVNGKVQSEHSRSYTYIYTPLKVGTFSIPGFSLKIGGRTYTTKPITVEVVDSPRQATPQYNPDPFAYPFGEEFEDRYRGIGESLILCMPASQSVYRGEPAVVSYYLYTNQSVRSFNLEDEKDWGGYGKAVYEQPTMLDFEDVSFRGERYKRSLIKRIVLFPQSTGRLQAPTLTGSMRLFEFGYLNKAVTSTPAYLEVKPLPAGAPEGFTGAVGSFSVSESYSDTQVNLGEAVSYTLKIGGKGNFSQFTAPPVPKLTAFQMSEPMAQDKFSTPIEGTRSIHYTIVPQQTGDFKLTGVRFSWFDSSAGEYRSFQPEPRMLKVKPANVLSYFSGILQSDKPMTLNPLIATSVYPVFRFHAGQLWWWLIVALILISLPISGFIAWERRLRQENPTAYAQKHASRILGKYLVQATIAARELSPEFYPLAQSGLIDYLAQKYQIAKGLSTSELLSALSQHTLSTNTLQQLGDFLETCHQARYMPGGAQAEAIAEDLDRLRKLVTALVGAKSRGTGQGKSSRLSEREL